MFLINAIYFKGDWVKKFPESSTQRGEFTTSNGNMVNPYFMSSDDSYAHFGDDDVEVARLPYGRDKIAMYVFLPREGRSLDSFLSGLTQESFDAYFPRLRTTDLIVTMPKFKLEYGKVDLKDTLTSMGMGVAFDRNAADFSGIADVEPQRLFIAFVDHKAFVEVNEKGTEAAAVTNVGISLTSAPSTTYCTVDRPYMFVIRESLGLNPIHGQNYGSPTGNVPIKI